MSNKIRFRAWHNELKRMCPVLTMEQLGTEHMRIYSPQGDVFSVNEIELMQWTGLFDSENQEIFEGDILLLQSEQPLFFQEVHFNNGAFMVGRKDVEATWWYLACCMQKHLVQVLGNIYENSELLNDKEGV